MAFLARWLTSAAEAAALWMPWWILVDTWSSLSASLARATALLVVDAATAAASALLFSTLLVVEAAACVPRFTAEDTLMENMAPNVSSADGAP